MNLDYQKIGNYIREKRQYADLTQAELSERLGVSAQSVSNWERGESLPDISLLPDLACILDCSVDTLLGGGKTYGKYRRRMSVSQAREAMDCLQRMSELMGRDHFMYRTMIDALDKQMNSTIELAFSKSNVMDAYICEILIGCVRDGNDYVDLDDIRKNILSDTPQKHTLQILKNLGIK